MRVPRFVTVLSALAALLILGPLLAVPDLQGQDSTVVQDSTTVAGEVLSNAPSLALALASVGLLTFLAWQLVKWGSKRMDRLPGFAHKLAVFIVASGLTTLGTVAGLPLPTTLDALTHDQLGQIITWGVTILLGGGTALASHAAKKATVG